MAYTQRVGKVGDQVLDVIRQVDDAAVKAARTVGERLGEMLPAELPMAEYMAKMPRPEEYVKLYFDFIERLVKTQRAYSMDLAKAFEPITGKIWKTAVRKAA